MIRKIASASVVYAMAPQLPKLVSLFMMPIITKYMTPLDYGISGIIMAYLAAFDALKDLGLGVVLTNSFFKHPKKYIVIWRRIHGAIQVWAVIYGLLLSVLLCLIIPDAAQKNYWKIAGLILVPIMFFESVITVGRLYFQLNKLPIKISIISVISGLITILFNYLFIVVYRQGYIGLLAGMFASSVFNFLVYIYFVYFYMKITPSLKFSWKWLKSKLKISFPTIPHFYAGYILNISDRVLMDLYKLPITEIGKYSFAYSIGAYFSIIGKSYFQASGPYYMEFNKQNSAEGDKKARNLSYFMQLILLMMAFFMAIWMKEIFHIMVNNIELRGTYMMAILVIFSYCYFPSYAYNSMKIWYSEKTKLLLKISFFAAIISLVLNIILIPTVGYFGSAISTYVSFLFMGYGGFLFKDIRSLFKINYNWWVWPLISSIAVLFTLHFSTYSGFAKLLLTGVLITTISLLFYLNKGKIYSFTKK